MNPTNNINEQSNPLQAEQFAQFIKLQEAQFAQFIKLEEKQFQELLLFSTGGGNSEKKTKPIKSKKKKKGASNAYAFFMKKNRGSIKELNPEATFGEMSGLVSMAWKALTEEEKKPFIELAEQDKIRVNTENAIVE